MKIHVQDSVARAAHQALQRVLKDGPAALFGPKTQQHLSLSDSHLATQHRVTTAIDRQSAVHARVSARIERSQSVDGNTVRVATNATLHSVATAQSRQAVVQSSDHLAQGQVNGKAIFAHSSRDLRQTSVAASATQVQESRRQLDATTRQTDNQLDKSGSTARVVTHVDSTQERERSQQTDATRRTETEVLLKTYDKSGKVISEKASHQAVSTTQSTVVDQRVAASASRDVEQTTSVIAGKDGVRQTRIVTDDSSTGHQVIETGTASKTATVVENLDKAGNVVSAKASGHASHTHETRAIDTARTQSTDQVSQVRLSADGSETKNKSSVAIHAATVDRIQSTTESQSLNGGGSVVSQRISRRDVTVATTEDRHIDSQSRNAVTKAGGTTIAEQDFSSRDHKITASQTTTDVGGVKSVRAVVTDVDTKTRGELENRIDADGRRTVAVSAEQTTRREVEDLSINAKGQGRLVETDAVSRRSLEGQLTFDPDTNKVGGPSKAFASIQFGAMTGLNTGFRMDAGVLEFDFETEVSTSTTQTVTAGQVVAARQGDTDFAAAPGSAKEQASIEKVRVKGQIVASRDAAGNNVVDVKASVVRAAAAIAAYGGSAVHAERSQSELTVDARLSASREVSATGKARTMATGEMQLDRVDRHEAAGNTPAPQRLTAADAVRAGFQIADGALRFNFGTFNLGISVFA